MVMRPDKKLEREVAAIGDLSREELIARWHKAYGCLPPKGINRSLLERSAAWHLQAGRSGGLSAAARAVLRDGRKSLARGRRREGGSWQRSVDGGGCAPGVRKPGRPDSTQSASRAGAAAPLAAGTRLLREWNGRMHVVDVTAEGVLFDGKLYRSLTAVAKRITGAHWSGPRFFGL